MNEECLKFYLKTHQIHLNTRPNLIYWRYGYPLITVNNGLSPAALNLIEPKLLYYQAVLPPQTVIYPQLRMWLIIIAFINGKIRLKTTLLWQGLHF